MSKNPLASRAAWFFAANVVNAAISFFTMILLARVLSPADYGLLAVYFTFTAVVTSLAGLSLDGSASIAFFKRPTEALCCHVTSGIVLIAVVCALLAALVTIFARVLTVSLGLELTWLLVALVCALSQATTNVKLAMWMAKGGARQYAAFQIGQGIVLAGLTAALVVGFGMGWQGRAWAQLVAVAAFGCAAMLLLLRHGECSRCIKASEMRAVLRFGVPLVPHIGGALLFSSADRFIVNGLLGPAATGLYQFAAQIGSIVMVVTDAINKAFAPWLYKNLNNATDAVRRRIVVLTYVYFLLAIGAGLLSFVQPWNIASLLGGSAYSAADPLVPFFILGHCIGGMYFMVVNYIFFSGRTGHLSVATLATGAVGATVTVAFAITFGLMGAAFAFSASKLLHFGATWVISSRLHPMPWRLRARAEN